MVIQALINYSLPPKRDMSCLQVFVRLCLGAAMAVFCILPLAFEPTALPWVSITVHSTGGGAVVTSASVRSNSSEFFSSSSNNNNTNYYPTSPNSHNVSAAAVRGHVALATRVATSQRVALFVNWRGVCVSNVSTVKVSTICSGCSAHDVSAPQQIEGLAADSRADGAAAVCFPTPSFASTLPLIVSPLSCQSASPTSLQRDQIIIAVLLGAASVLCIVVTCCDARWYRSPPRRASVAMGSSLSPSPCRHICVMSLASLLLCGCIGAVVGIFMSGISSRWFCVADGETFRASSSVAVGSSLFDFALALAKAMIEEDHRLRVDRVMMHQHFVALHEVNASLWNRSDRMMLWPTDENTNSSHGGDDDALDASDSTGVDIGPAFWLLVSAATIAAGALPYLYYVTATALTSPVYRAVAGNSPVTDESMVRVISFVGDKNNGVPHRGQLRSAASHSPICQRSDNVLDDDMGNSMSSRTHNMAHRAHTAEGSFASAQRVPSLSSRQDGKQAVVHDKVNLSQQSPDGSVNKRLVHQSSAVAPEVSASASEARKASFTGLQRQIQQVGDSTSRSSFISLASLSGARPWEVASQESCRNRSGYLRSAWTAAQQQHNNSKKKNATACSPSVAAIVCPGASREFPPAGVRTGPPSQFLTLDPPTVANTVSPPSLLDEIPLDHDDEDHFDEDPSCFSAQLQWRKDSATGLFWSKRLMVFFNPQDRRYFDPRSGEWFATLDQLMDAYPSAA